MASSSLTAARAGETLPLRWLRAGWEHPLRSALACLCLGLACAARRGGDRPPGAAGPEGVDSP